MADTIIYHLARANDWAAAVQAGSYQGSAEDRVDGFLHFSTGAQVRESAARHRKGERSLILVAVAADRLGAALKWEPARGGALFPHLFGALPISAVLWTQPLDLGADGSHRFPDSIA